MTTTVHPTQLVIEVDDDIELFDADPYLDEIRLVAYVGTERHVLATTHEMSGYGAKNDPRRCLKLLLQEVLR